MTPVLLSPKDCRFKMDNRMNHPGYKATGFAVSELSIFYDNSMISGYLDDYQLYNFISGDLDKNDFRLY